MTFRKNWAIAAAVLFGFAAPAFAENITAGALPPEKQAVLAQLWPVEQSIYVTRGHGDLNFYLEHTSTQFVAWPPMIEAPESYQEFRATQGEMKPSKRKISLEFQNLALSGDSAVLYYRTHLTMMPDGTPCDDYFAVMHSYVRENGVWKVLGGMARLEPKR